MRPYARGRNRDTDHRLRESFLGRTWLYLHLFCADIAWLWSTRDIPAFVKTAATLLILLLMNLPVAYLILVTASTMVSIRLLTLDPVDWSWQILDPLGLLNYQATPGGLVAFRRFTKNATNTYLFMISVYDILWAEM